MCGIIGIIGNNNVAPLLVEALKRLEYRGYDSAGIATLHNNKLHCSRSEGKISKLEKELQNSPLQGTLGIGHTRWATHGIPSTTNAHPHITDKVAVIHNGIIENFKELRSEYEKKGYKFHSQTDTEVIPVIITDYLNQGFNPHKSVVATLKKLKGAFALGILFLGEDDLLVAARRGSPLAIGYGDGEMYVASDAYALAPLTGKITYLEDGDFAEISRKEVKIYDNDNNMVHRDVKISALSGAAIGKGDYRHFMLKEIFEQPVVIADTLNSFYNQAEAKIAMPLAKFNFADLSRITMVACGTSYFSALTAKYWFEQVAKIPCDVEVASEFRYSDRILDKNGAAIFISQSGETADTLAALRYAKEKKQKIISVVNSSESSMAHESDMVLHTLAGPEIGVASTKAFTTQLTTLACLTIFAARQRNAISRDKESQLAHLLSEVPSRISEILTFEDKIKQISLHIADARSAIYIGRGTSFPIAMEGALKLKEISYIHAEGIAAGELKHGPIALIDENVPVVVLAPFDELFDKTASNIEEVAARGGRVILITDKKGKMRLQHLTNYIIEMPQIDSFVNPILYSVPIQLLAYHVALVKGTDIDQPRNLAKSVTVE